MLARKSFFLVYFRVKVAPTIFHIYLFFQTHFKFTENVKSLLGLISEWTITPSTKFVCLPAFPAANCQQTFCYLKVLRCVLRLILRTIFETYSGIYSRANCVNNNFKFYFANDWLGFMKKYYITTLLDFLFMFKNHVLLFLSLFL